MWPREAARLAHAVKDELDRLGVEVEPDADGDVAISLGELAGRASAVVTIAGRERTFVFADDGTAMLLPEQGEILPPAA